MGMAGIKHLADGDFEKVVAESPVTIVDFYADWCGPCKMFAPVFEASSVLRPGVLFAKLDVDKAKEVAAKYKVSSIPTIMLFKNGKVTDHFLGYKPKEEVLKFIDRHA